MSENNNNESMANEMATAYGDANQKQMASSIAYAYQSAEDLLYFTPNNKTEFEEIKSDLTEQYAKIFKPSPKSETSKRKTNQNVINPLVISFDAEIQTCLNNSLGNNQPYTFDTLIQNVDAFKANPYASQINHLKDLILETDWTNALQAYVKHSYSSMSVESMNKDIIKIIDYNNRIKRGLGPILGKMMVNADKNYFSQLKNVQHLHNLLLGPLPPATPPKYEEVKVVLKEMLGLKGAMMFVSICSNNIKSENEYKKISQIEKDQVKNIKAFIKSIYNDLQEDFNQEIIEPRNLKAQEKYKI